MSKGTFTFEFEEIAVMVDGRGKLITGEFDCTYDRYVDDYYGVCWEVDPAAHMVITSMVDDETEEGVPCSFELTHKMETFQAIITQIDHSRYTMEDAAAAYHDQGC